MHIPTEAEERVRDLVRCRSTFQREILTLWHYVLTFLARRGLVYREGTPHVARAQPNVTLTRTDHLASERKPEKWPSRTPGPTTEAGQKTHPSSTRTPSEGTRRRRSTGRETCGSSHTTKIEITIPLPENGKPRRPRADKQESKPCGLVQRN